MGAERTPERTADYETQWTAASLARERQGFVFTSILGAVLVPLWGIFDKVLEPALLRPFLWLRGTDFVVGAALLFAILRARRLPTLRLLGAMRILLVGTVIAFMCPRVSEAHYFPYILGFSLVFWSNGILHTWPLRYSLALWGTLLASYLFARSVVGIERPVVDEVAALFYLASTAVISTATVENRRRLHYQAFALTYDLATRNRELDATLRSLRETQTRLVEGEKLSALGRLIASLSHEINNPMNVLRNNLGPLRAYVQKMTDVLEVARAGGDVKAAWASADLDFVLNDAVGAIETMDMGVQRIQGVHGEMRAFVRGDAPEMQRGDLNEGLRATVNMFRRSLPKEIAMAVHCGDLPETLFQPGQMNQVFFNLIQNAVDAIESTGRGGAISIRTEVDNGWIALKFEDTGSGVSPWAREHLFEPFFTTKGAGKGTGLGLATSYQIVQRHKGRIELDEEYRSGARFLVLLPIAVVRSGSAFTVGDAGALDAAPARLQ